MKKLLKMAGILIGCLCLLTGCGDEAQKEPSDPTINVQLDYKVEPAGIHQYKVSGTTNLPDGTELMVSLDNRQIIGAKYGVSEDTRGDQLPDDLLLKIAGESFASSEKPAVKNGKFECLLHGDNLLPGEYDLSFTVPIWRVMKNEDVKKRLGEGNKNLAGEHVEDSGMEGEGKVYRNKTRIKLD